MKILMVLTSHDKLGNTGRKTGFWLEEFAAPYFTFKDAGAEIVIASPKGGQPPLDPKSNEPNFQTELTHRFEADADAQARLATTVRLDRVKQEDYDTVFSRFGCRGKNIRKGSFPITFPITLTGRTAPGGSVRALSSSRR